MTQGHFQGQKVNLNVKFAIFLQIQVGTSVRASFYVILTGGYVYFD